MVKDCKEVILDTSGRVAGLFKRSFPEATVYGTLKYVNNDWPAKHKIDAHIHISHLPLFYRKKDSDFPRTAYLKADPERCAKWREWLSHLPRPWIGIAWRGGITRTNEAARSMELREWRPIIEQGGSFISLAYQDVEHEMGLWNAGNNPVIHQTQIDNDGTFDEWTALANELDLVISATTTIAHVRAALGKRVWVLVPEHPPWQHVYGGNSMIWYPESAWLNYRQNPGEPDWTHTINRVAADYGRWIVPRAPVYSTALSR
jgi:ADP-heptose:LPS heptosyltransferase